MKKKEPFLAAIRELRESGSFFLYLSVDKKEERLIPPISDELIDKLHYAYKKRFPYRYFEFGNYERFAEWVRSSYSFYLETLAALLEDELDEPLPTYI